MVSDNFRFVGRQTEEGFMIYKEDELGIRDEGGGELRQLRCSRN